MIELTVQKALMSASIFLAALLGGLPPLWAKQTRFWQSFFFFSEHLARGIFLSAGLIHLLPDAAHVYQVTHIEQTYPVTFLICAMTIFMIQAIEQIASVQKLSDKSGKSYTSWVPYCVLLLLSIHSIIAGSALGVDTNERHVLIIFLAIIAHKTAETFALGTTLCTETSARKIQAWLILLFATLSPISVMTSAYLVGALQGHEILPLQSIFSAITAGTFLYIAFLKNPKLETHPLTPHSTVWSTLAFGVGIAIMALAAVHNT